MFTKVKSINEHIVLEHVTYEHTESEWNSEHIIVELM